MSILLHQLIHNSATRAPDSPAVSFQGTDLIYRELSDYVGKVADGLIHVGLEKHTRVAIYLPKQFETVISFFAVSQAGGVFVPVNPLLKSHQVEYILQDCSANVLITNLQRLNILLSNLEACPELRTIIVVDALGQHEITNVAKHIQVISWEKLQVKERNEVAYHRVIETDMVSILYTSGSTGKPKGVVLSHLNMVTGAESVAQYLGNSATDRLLAVLPFSFDYGFSQLTTAFYSGASVVLIDYLLPVNLTRVIEQEAITGIAAVPTLWMQLKNPIWPEKVKKRLRYITNSGGVLPVEIIRRLREQLPDTDIYLMYGFTEAFRSTYLPPDEIDRRPDSIGKAIPNADLVVINDKGQPCVPNEYGELVHRGPLVALGYWNDPEKTAECFRPTPGHSEELPLTEFAAWSGDTVCMDDEGFLYFVERRDNMIKTSGYRVSPTEVEEVIYTSGMANEVVALGIPHQMLGQAILVLITTDEVSSDLTEKIMYACKQQLPNYMLPQAIEVVNQIPKNANGKIDRQAIQAQYSNRFQNES